MPIKKHSFFSVQEKAWHNLGKILQNYLASAEASKLSGLDYELVKRKLFIPSLGETSF